MRNFFIKIIPGILILLGLSYLYCFMIRPPPEDMEMRYMITYCRYLCKKAIIDGKIHEGIVLSEVYREVQVPAASTLLGNITRNKTILWRWDYACCVERCNFSKKIILDGNCTFIEIYPK